MDGGHGQDQDRQITGSEAAALYGRRLREIQDRDQEPYPQDKECDWCPVDTRDLYAVAQNACTAYERALADGADTRRLVRKMAELRAVLDRVQIGIYQHFKEVHSDRDAHRR